MLKYKTQCLLPVEKADWRSLKEEVSTQAYKALISWWETRLHQAERQLLYKHRTGEWNEGYLAGQLSLAKYFLDDMKSVEKAKDNTKKRVINANKGKIQFLKNLVRNTK